MRIRRLPQGLLVPVLVIAATAGVVSSTSAQSRSPDPAVDAQAVIVILADQHDDAPATAAGSGQRAPPGARGRGPAAAGRPDAAGGCDGYPAVQCGQRVRRDGAGCGGRPVVGRSAGTGGGTGPGGDGTPAAACRRTGSRGCDADLSQ